MIINNEMELKKIFGHELYKARVESGTTVKELANGVGKSVNTYSNWESGKSCPTVAQFIKAFKVNNHAMLRPALNVTIPQIYYKLNENSPLEDILFALDYYVDNVASNTEIRYKHFLMYGEHGSIFDYQTELILAHILCSTKNEFPVLQGIWEQYKIFEGLGQLECENGIDPDKNLIENGLKRLWESVLQGRPSYNIIPDIREDDINKGIAKLISDARYNSGMTISEVAFAMSKDDRTIMNWESGKIIPTAANVVLLFEAMNQPFLSSAINMFFYDDSENTSEIEKMKQDIKDYYKSKPIIARKNAFFAFAPHGAIARFVTAIWVAYDRLPMNSRYAFAKTTYNNYMIHGKNNPLASEYNIEPDLKVLEEGVEKGLMAASNGENSYA